MASMSALALIEAMPMPRKCFSGAYVDQGASRDLQGQSGDRADGQDKAYMELRPRPRGR